MRNRIAVTIAGQEYTLVAEEDGAYVRKVADHVDAKVKEVEAEGRLPMMDCAVLAALNIADEYYKELAASENLRRRIKENMDETTRLEAELSEAKREIFKLQNNRG